MPGRVLPTANLAKARAKQANMNMRTRELRDVPLIRRLASLDEELGRNNLVDLVHSAIQEGHAKNMIQYSFPGYDIHDQRDRARNYLRELLSWQRTGALSQKLYDALEYAVKELEGMAGESGDAAEEADAKFLRKYGDEEEELLSVSSDMRKLRLALQEEGFYELVSSGGGHLKVVTGPNHPAGADKVVVDDYGPVTIASTPSDRRWRKNTVARLRRTSFVGVPLLNNDPFSSVAEPSSQIPFSVNEQRRREGIEQRNLHNIEQTLRARQLAEPLVNRIGSWSNYNFLHELADVILHYGKTRGVERWFNLKSQAATHDGVFRAITRLHKGETLSEPAHEGMIVFFSELGQAGDPVARYIELLRESKGLATLQVVPEPAPEAAEPSEPFTEAPSGIGDVTFALEVLYEMTVGRDPSTLDRERLLSLALRTLDGR